MLQKLVVGKAQLWSYYGINNVESLKIESKTKNADYVLTNVINGSGIIDFYRNEGSVESINRIENIEELRSGINDFILEQKEFIIINDNLW